MPLKFGLDTAWKQLVVGIVFFLSLPGVFGSLFFWGRGLFNGPILDHPFVTIPTLAGLLVWLYTYGAFFQLSFCWIRNERVTRVFLVRLAISVFCSLCVLPLTLLTHNLFSTHDFDWVELWQMTHALVFFAEFFSMPSILFFIYLCFYFWPQPGPQLPEQITPAKSRQRLKWALFTYLLSVPSLITYLTMLINSKSSAKGLNYVGSKGDIPWMYATVFALVAYHLLLSLAWIRQRTLMRTTLVVNGVLALCVSAASSFASCHFDKICLKTFDDYAIVFTGLFPVMVFSVWLWQAHWQRKVAPTH